MTDPTYLDDIITRIVAQCKEAVPDTKEAFDYHGATYANYPYWTVGETQVTTEVFGAELELGVQVSARLHGGKIEQDKKGVVEKRLRGYIPVLIAYFAQHLDLTSTAYPEPMEGVIENGVFLNPIRRVLFGPSPDVFGLELTFTIPVLQDRAGGD